MLQSWVARAEGVASWQITPATSRSLSRECLQIWAALLWDGGFRCVGLDTYAVRVCCRSLIFGDCGECGRRLWLVPRVRLGLARDGVSFGYCGVLWVQPGRLVFQSPREM